MSHSISRTAAILLTGLSFFFATLVQAQPWIPVGPSPPISQPDANYISITIDKHGTPYVAFNDDSHTYSISVKKFDGSNWIDMGVTGLGGDAKYISIVTDTSGVPYIAFYDGATSGHASVMKYNGTAWEFVGDRGYSTLSAYRISLALDPQGMPCVAYMNGNWSSASATVMRFDGSNWVYVGGSIFVNYITDLSLAISSDGTIYSAFTYDFSGSYGPVQVLRFSGSVWSSTTSSPTISTGGATTPSIDVAPDGTPYIAYYDYDAMQMLIKKLSGTAWTNVDSAGAPFVGPELTRLKVSKDNIPYLLYNYGNWATVSKCSGSQWQIVGDTAITKSMWLYASLAVSPDGVPFVAYMDFADSNRAVVKRPTFATYVPAPLESKDDVLLISPLPNDGSFTLRISTTHNENATVSINNCLGQQVYRKHIPSNTEQPFNIDAPPGLYFVIVETVRNKTVARMFVSE